MRKSVVIGFLAMIVIIFAQEMLLSKEKRENKRLENNQEALMNTCQEYKTEAGKNAMSSYQLELKCSELENNYKDVCAKAEDLKIKIKRLQSVSDAGTKTEVKIKTVVKDSIVYRGSVTIDTIKVFAWQDPWVSIQGKLLKDTTGIDIVSRDTLTQFIHRIPHKFWFIRWGTKAIKQEIRCSNPHTQLEYIQHIELK